MIRSHLHFAARGCLVASLLACLPGAPAIAADSVNEPPRLARLPRPWAERTERLTVAEYEATLRHWAAKHPKLVTIQRRGQSADGLGIHLVKVTDSSVPDKGKQVALVTTLHGGPERVNVTTALSLVQWLLGDSPEARDLRREQVILVMPIINPHAFFVSETFGNAGGVDIYDGPQENWDLEKLTLADPAKTPELAALTGVVDDYRPEVHLDLHGSGLQSITKAQQPDRRMFAGHMMFEVSGSYSRIQVRPWDPRVIEAMVAAGQRAGFGSTRAEADAQRNFWLPDHDMFSDQLWMHDRRAGRFRSQMYGYLKYHTMISTMEIGWEDSGVARIAGVLALGNQPWIYNREKGYPVDRIRARANRFITTWGRTAAERRVSRVELWQAQHGFMDGMLYPEYEGRTIYVCAVTEAGRKHMNSNPRDFAAKLRGVPGMNAAAIEEFMAAGPEVRLSGSTSGPAPDRRPQHGIGFRFCLPYLHPALIDVALNGHTLAESDIDGYRAWQADGYTQVQINVPPEKSRELDFYVVTCAYDPKEQRSAGFKLPAEVREQLKSPGPAERR